MGELISQVQPGAVVENKKVKSSYDKYTIEARDDKGNLVYSKVLDLDELDRAGN